MASPPSAASSAAMQAFDLTPVISQYLDRHMVVQLIDFLQEHQLYSSEMLLRTKLALVSQTKMLDVEKSVFQQLHPDAALPAEMNERRPALIAQIKALKERCSPLLDVIENHELVASLRERGSFSVDALSGAPHHVNSQHVAALYAYARFKFDLSHYADAGDYLEFFRQLASREDERALLAAWGSLAAEILRPETPEGAETSLAMWYQLRDLIESRTFVSATQQLQQRTWLLHWALFVCFNHEQNRPLLVDLFMQEKLLNTIQTAAPHLLRYLTAAAIAHKQRRRHVLSDLVAVLDAEAHTFSDPITEFLRALLVDFDFDAAQRALVQCERVCASDFFLSVIVGDFVDGARTLMLETYFKLHSSVKLATLRAKFALTAAEAAHWIAALGGDAAKLAIAVEQGDGGAVAAATAVPPAEAVVRVTAPHASAYAHVMEKTKPLLARTQTLVASLERRERHDRS